MGLADFDISFDVKFKALKYGLEVNGFGYGISWLVDWMGAVLDNFSVAFSAGTRSSCMASLYFYNAAVLIATIFFASAVVGGDLLGLLVAAKQKVLCYQVKAKDE